MDWNNRKLEDYELAVFIKKIEQDHMMQAPKHLKQEILAASKSIQVQAAVTKNRTSARIELFWYSLKITAAVIATLSFFSVMDSQIPVVRPEINFSSKFSMVEILDNSSSQLNGMLNEFANKIVHE